MEHPLNVLICFSKPQTGESLGALAAELIRGKNDHSEVTVLHLVGKEQWTLIDNADAYKSRLFENIVARCEENDILVRTFVKPSDAFVNDILETGKEQNCNLVLLGIGGNVLNSSLWEKFKILKNDANNSEEFVYGQFETPVAQSLESVSSLLFRNYADTGIFVDNSFEKADKLFVPILDKDDTDILPLLKRFMRRENASATVWDAIGILSSPRQPEIQKYFRYLQKKFDGRIALWDNNRKIDASFIENQELILTGIDGWNKLITTALPWKDSLPSILVIKKGHQEN
ncbi:MAG: hypothetical protein LBR48_03510 [Dysgonamonadaceae bacterium]|jgi:hypothetical protein|nr:hypothetical protein [Dysgonamonadaceae bacterium]